MYITHEEDSKFKTSYSRKASGIGDLSASVSLQERKRLGAVLDILFRASPCDVHS